ncbi:MAG: hypothetical protein MAG451_01359 [Anaerolineales bacterium]|nr:hypothetical protein [Anaerolineales bacterium]
MKRRMTIALTFGLLLTLAVAGAALAQPGGIQLTTLPGSGWWVSWQVQNVGDQEANLQVEAIAADGTTFGSASASTTLSAGGAISFIPGKGQLQPELEEGFIGSAVLSADQPIVAIGNVANNELASFGIGVPGGVAAAQYQGVSGDDADTQVNFPLVKNDFAGQTTTFYVQAAGQAADITIAFNMNDGSSYTADASLEADEMHVFSPDDASVPKTCSAPSSTAACVGSAVATSSTGAIVGVYTEHPTSSDPATLVLSTRGFTPGDADSEVAVPVIKNQWVDRTTALTVQNAEASADVTVNVTFKGIAGACADNSYSGDQATLSPGASVIYFPNLGNMGGLPEGCFAAATVSASGGKVVATVNEAGAGKKTVYGAFGVSNATKKAALPLVKEIFSSRTTGVVVQNAGDGPTDVTVEYSVVTKQSGANPGTVTLDTFTIEAGAAVSLFQISQNSGVWGAARSELSGTNSGVIITSTSENIVAIAQESGVGIDVDIKNYEGFNIE